MTTQPAPRAAVILAAGQGTRMKSPLHKVLHKVGHRTLLDRAIDTAEALGCERIIVVAAGLDEPVARHAAARLGADAIAVQNPPLGTGHAVLSAKAALADFSGDVVVTYADGLLDADVAEPLFGLRAAGADVAVLGFEAAVPGGYGRLILKSDNLIARIVEAKDANDSERAVRLCNSGVLAADRALLFALLEEVTPNNAKGEYYLTDVVGIANRLGKTVRVDIAAEDAFLGVNSQSELAEAEAAFQQRRRSALMAEGVSMPAPETVHLAFDTRIEAGALIEPYVVFGPGVRVASRAVVRAFSHLEGCVVGEGALIGPYARLRPGADIGAEAHIGNFVEVKKVTVGPGAKANHLSYLGDGTVGAGANIGAGTIFCNYDGFDKHNTHVGANAFIGSNSALVAPVTIGEGAYTGSGSVITSDVAPNALALERGQQLEKPGWASRFRALKLARRK